MRIIVSILLFAFALIAIASPLGRVAVAIAYISLGASLLVLATITERDLIGDA